MFIFFVNVFFSYLSSDLCVEEELVFIDNLENFRKKLPTSSLLLSRLQFFLVKDPLLHSEGQNFTEENIFRYLQIVLEY